jgi:arsenite-transporting ATPase
MTIIDTRNAAKLFSRYQVPICGYIVNRVIPSELAQQEIPEYLRHRIEMQRRFLQQIDDTFGDDVLTQVPEFERDITGLEMIGKVADALFGGEA